MLIFISLEKKVKKKIQGFQQPRAFAYGFFVPVTLPPVRLLKYQHTGSLRIIYSSNQKAHM